MLTKKNAAWLVILATCVTPARAQQGRPQYDQAQFAGSPRAVGTETQPDTHVHAIGYAAGYSTAPVQQVSSVYTSPYSCPGAACPGCSMCEKDHGWLGKWIVKLRPFRQNSYYKHHGKTYGFLHPASPPVNQANWGYHQTCWRRFPPLCYDCPPQDQPLMQPGQHVPPAPGQGEPPPPAVPYDPTGYRGDSFGNDLVAPSTFQSANPIESGAWSSPSGGSPETPEVAPTGFDYVDEVAPEMPAWRPTTSERSDVPPIGFESIDEIAPDSLNWRPSPSGRSDVVLPGIEEVDAPSVDEESLPEFGQWLPTKSGRAQLENVGLDSQDPEIKSGYSPFRQVSGKAQVPSSDEIGDDETNVRFKSGHSSPSGRAPVVPAGFDALQSTQDAEPAKSGRVELDDLDE